MALPSRTQITAHSCQEGWTAIGQWTGVQLARVLSTTGLKPNARFVFFHAADGWYDSVHLFDALHSQTLLAYGMNGGPLPIAHGAPVRLRVERHLGYKSIKFVKRIEVVESLAEVGNGLGSSGAAYGYSWNSGI
ncbi:MAG: molybdopterin-dependent oxidoreductase [Alphaproteobacteria bacterium]